MTSTDLHVRLLLDEILSVVAAAARTSLPVPVGLEAERLVKKHPLARIEVDEVEREIVKAATKFDVKVDHGRYSRRR